MNDALPRVWRGFERSAGARVRFSSQLEVSVADLRNAIGRGECEGVEFKRSLDIVHTAPRSVERTIAALANSTPHGIALLVFGVEDSGEVLGLVDQSGTRGLAPRDARTRRQQFSQIASRIRPKLDYSWRECDFDRHTLTVVSIRGRSGRTVFRTSSGETPYRQDAFTHYADPEIVDAWRKVESAALADDLESSVKIWKKLATQLYSDWFLFPRRDVPFKPNSKALPRLRYETSRGAADTFIYAKRALLANRRVGIIGPAGSGKTFLLRWTAFRAARNGAFLRKLGLPFYVQLRAYRGSLIDLLIESCSCKIDRFLSISHWEELLQKHQSCLLLDGLDECSDVEAVLNELKDLSEYNPGIRVVATTRILDQQVRDGLVALGFKLMRIEPLRASQLDSFLGQYGGLRGPRVKLLVEKLMARLEHCTWEVFPLGLGHIGNPLTLNVVLHYIEQGHAELPEVTGHLFKAGLVDGLLRKPSAVSRGTRFPRAWQQRRVEALAAIASTMCAGGCSRSSLPEYEVAAAIDNAVGTGRRNYKDLRDELLEDLLELGLIVSSARGISFSHELIRDFFWAWAVALQGERSWDGVLCNYRAHAAVVYLSGLIENPYRLLDCIYERARFDSHLAGYLAIGLEHGANVCDSDRNAKYLRMIFFYGDGAQFLGLRSLLHIRRFIAESGGVTWNLSATQRYLEILNGDTRERRSVLEECFSANWHGKWVLLPRLPELGTNRMVRLARDLWREAPSPQKRLRILNVLSKRRSILVCRLLEELERGGLDDEEREVVALVLGAR